MKNLILALLMTVCTGVYCQTNNQKALQDFEAAKEAFSTNYATEKEYITGMMKTESELNQSLELDQSIANVFYYRALLFISADQNLEAIEFLEYAIQRDSVNAEYHLRKGVTQTKIEYYTAAMASFNQALVYAPEDPNIYFNRGMIYYYTDQADNACKSFKEALSLGLASAQEAIDQTCK
jgi:tetratricopeptide (TPR) repeat protein